jgi:hypothetical protein
MQGVFCFGALRIHKPRVRAGRRPLARVVGKRKKGAMTRLQTLRVLISCCCLTWANIARADVVTDWNVITAQEIGTRPGPSGLLDLAMVHVAMHDAIQAFEGRFEAYAITIPNAAGSPVAAAAAAAHAVLVARFPADQASLDTAFTNYLTAQGLLGDPGVAIGEQAAAAIVAARANDGSFPANPEQFFGGTGPGEWRSELPTPAPMVTSWLAAVVPFTLKDSAQFRASPPPPHLNSGEYAKAYNEVKALGALDNSARMPEQTDIAYFFSDNSIQYWNRTLRGIADTYLDDIGDSARLFALANMAIADAVITAWDNKRYWNFWRPITAIHEGDNDGNAHTEADPDWVPFLTTPNYPDYTSGSNSVSGATTTMLARFFGTDKVTFSITSAIPQVVQNPRVYARFSEAAADIVNARIYEGIHFRFADEVARRQATHVANWAFSHFLRPLGH